MVPDRLRRTCSRRDVLRASAAALPVALAGCSSSCPDSDPPTPSTVVSVGDDPTGALPASAVAPNWETFRHDQHNTGFGRATAPPGDTAALAWRTDVASSPSAPVLADGTLYVAAGDGTLHALDARDGTENWQHEAVAAREAPTVRSGAGLLVVAGADGVVALDVPEGDGGAASPTTRWRVDRPATASVVVDTDRVFVPSDGALLAFDAATGEEAWRATFDGPVTRPALAGETVLATGSHLRAFDVSDGTERWHAGPGGVSAFPVVDAGADLVYHGNYDGLTAVDLASGETRWQFERGGGRGFDAPVVTPDTLYAIERVGEGPDAIYALDPDTGEPDPRWCSWLGEGTVSAAGTAHVLVETSVAPDRAANADSALQSFRRETGQATWQFRAPGSVLAPALGDGAAFVATRAGAVCALGNGGDGS